MNRCETCKKYSALHHPWKVDEKNCIYGFCFKSYHGNYGSIYPVYLPGGGVCKAFEKISDRKNFDYEIDPDFRCECCKKELKEKIAKCLT